MFATFALGTGAAIVGSGTTESEDYNVNCCVVRSPLHVRGEGGVFIRPNMAAAVAIRLGFPLGTEAPNAKGAALSGVLRLEWLSALGPRLHAGAGFGLLRYPITVVNDPGFNGSDTVAVGPFLVEAGGGYALAIGGGASLVIDISALGALATGDEASGTHVESGLNLEAEAGLLLRR